MKEIDEQLVRELDNLHENIQRGIAEADGGELEDVDDGIMDRIRAAGLAILASHQAPLTQKK